MACRFLTPASPSSAATSPVAGVWIEKMAAPRHRRSTTWNIARERSSVHVTSRYLRVDETAAPRVSSMSSHETGTISADGTARIAQIAEKERPLAKVPLYSGPFIPNPTRRLAIETATVRTMYAPWSACGRGAAPARAAQTPP